MISNIMENVTIVCSHLRTMEVFCYGQVGLYVVIDNYMELMICNNALK